MNLEGRVTYEKGYTRGMFVDSVYTQLMTDGVPLPTHSLGDLTVYIRRQDRKVDSGSA